jgi:hypothetical protein
MGSSSTNKQPLMVDRPLHEFTTLGPTPALTDPTNLASILPSGCVLLVDCTGEDGAVVDSISVVANQQNTSAVRVLFFLSRSPNALGINSENTALVASALIVSTTPGERVNVSLPALAVPVPTLQGVFGVLEQNPTPGDAETAKKNNGLYIPQGKTLYTGLSAAITAPTPATRVGVFAMGGFF